MSRKIMTLDFDGVLHVYSSGWQGYGIVADPPVEGAIEFVEAIVESKKFNLNVFSSRNTTDEGIEAMKAWFLKHGLKAETLAAIIFPKHKPAASVGLDDRVITFTGKFPSIDTLYNFKPWNKK